MSFLSDRVNVTAPSGYFAPEMVSYLIAVYGEDAADAGTVKRTIYCRQDTEDPLSRRACSPADESPQPLNNGNILIAAIYPSTGVYSAVINGSLSGVAIVPDNVLSGFLAQYSITGGGDV